MPKTKTNEDSKRAVTIYLSEIDCELLACLDENQRTRHDQQNGLNHSVADVLQRLADHAVTGVYRPCCWERQWITQLFPHDFETNLEPGDPYGRSAAGDRDLWQRPRKNGRRLTPTLPTPTLPCPHSYREDSTVCEICGE